MESHLLQMRGLKLLLLSIFCTLIGVASFTDAWIETEKDLPLNLMKGVASFTDAWIETSEDDRTTTTRWSHLLQMRGLKLVNHPV